MSGNFVASIFNDWFHEYSLVKVSSSARMVGMGRRCRGAAPRLCVISLQRDYPCGDVSVLASVDASTTRDDLT
jgi:hypothetical protein